MCLDAAAPLLFPFPLSLSQCSPLFPKTGTHGVITVSNQPQTNPVTVFTQLQIKALTCSFAECLYGFITYDVPATLPGCSLAVPRCLFLFSLTCVVNKGTLLRAVLLWREAVTWEPLTPPMSRFVPKNRICYPVWDKPIIKYFRETSIIDFRAAQSRVVRGVQQIQHIPLDFHHHNLYTEIQS